jgi:hypothetical protein
VRAPLFIFFTDAFLQKTHNTMDATHAADTDSESGKAGAATPLVDVDAVIVGEDTNAACDAACCTGRPLPELADAFLTVVVLLGFMMLVVGVSLFASSGSYNVGGSVLLQIFGVCAFVYIAVVYCMLPDDNVARFRPLNFLRFICCNRHWPRALLNWAIRHRAGIGLTLGLPSLLAAIVLLLIAINDPLADVPLKRATFSMWIVALVTLVPTGSIDLLKRSCSQPSE